MFAVIGRAQSCVIFIMLHVLRYFIAFRSKFVGIRLLWWVEWPFFSWIPRLFLTVSFVLPRFHLLLVLLTSPFHFSTSSCLLVSNHAIPLLLLRTFLIWSSPLGMTHLITRCNDQCVTDWWIPSLVCVSLLISLSCKDPSTRFNLISHIFVSDKRTHLSKVQWGNWMGSFLLLFLLFSLSLCRLF